MLWFYAMLKTNKMKTNGNDSASPVLYQDGRNESKTGLTKREMFAMSAMQGLLANSAVTFPFGYPELIESIAADSVMHADALINALNK